MRAYDVADVLLRTSVKEAAGDAVIKPDSSHLLRQGLWHDAPSRGTAWLASTTTIIRGSSKISVDPQSCLRDSRRWVCRAGVPPSMSS